MNIMYILVTVAIYLVHALAWDKKNELGSKEFWISVACLVAVQTATAIYATAIYSTWG